MNNRSTINGYRIHHDGNFNENIGILKNLTNGYEYYYPSGNGYFEITRYEKVTSRLTNN